MAYYIQKGFLYVVGLSVCSRLLRFRFHWTGDTTIGTVSSHNGIVMLIKMEVCECRENVRETGDGRVTDRTLLLYGQFVSLMTGTSQ
jgi:hypothetical protein